MALKGWVELLISLIGMAVEQVCIYWRKCVCGLGYKQGAGNEVDSELCVFMVICKQGLTVRNWNHMRLSRGWGWGACGVRANVRGFCWMKYSFRATTFYWLTGNIWRWDGIMSCTGLLTIWPLRQVGCETVGHLVTNASYSKSCWADFF